jgi:Tfp pilus assembly protein PilO
MKGTRIMLALNKKLAGKRNEAKINRLQKVIEVALANAEEQKAKAEDRLDSLIENFNVDTDIQPFIQDVSRALYSKDEAESAIKQLKRINTYLFEDMDIPEDSEK